MSVGPCGFKMADKRGSSENSNQPLHKKLRADDGDARLRQFLKWCDNEDLWVSEKVQVGREGSCSQYGMVAIADINAGECLFEVPREQVLSPQSTGIAKLLHDEAESIQSASGWVPILLTLLHEYTNANSRWRSYLDLFPNYSELELPMFWRNSEVQEELKNTGVPQAVTRDIQCLNKEFVEIVLPFVRRMSHVFPPECTSLELYKKLVAFVMAYSFTEPVPGLDDSSDTVEPDKTPSPMMVPMADILNHVANNNAHLDFGKDSLRMMATKAIKKGEEVFNTYGELPNWQLLQMYGFAEPFPNNHYDTVDMPMKFFFEGACDGLEGEELAFMQEKWTFLKEMGLVFDGGSFVLGVEGILTEDEAFTALKVLNLDKQKFADYKEKDGWSSDEENGADGTPAESLTFGDIPRLPQRWKHIMRRAAESCLAGYNTKVEDEEAKLISPTWSTLSKRKQYCVYVRHGQLRLLHELLENCIAAR